MKKVKELAKANLKLFEDARACIESYPKGKKSKASSTLLDFFILAIG